MCFGHMGSPPLVGSPTRSDCSIIEHTLQDFTATVTVTGTAIDIPKASDTVWAKNTSWHQSGGHRSFQNLMEKSSDVIIRFLLGK